MATETAADPVAVELTGVQARITAAKDEISTKKTQIVSLRKEFRELRAKADACSDESARVQILNEAESTMFKANAIDHPLAALNAEIDGLRAREMNLLSKM